MDQQRPGVQPGEERTPRGGIVDLIQDLDAIVWEAEADGVRFTFVSRRAEELLGYPVQQWLAEPDFWAGRLVHPDDRIWAPAFCRRASEEGRDHRFEYRAVAADGRVVWLRDIVRVVRGADGRRHLRGVMFDITEQKRAEEALRESEQRFRSLIENISDIIVVVDAEQRLRYLSPSAERVLGYPVDAMLGRALHEFVHPEDMPALDARIRRWLLAGSGETSAARFQARDGSWRFLQVSGRAHEFADDGPTAVLAARDVSEQTRSDAELRRQRAYFVRLFEDSPEAIVLLDEADRVLRINHEFSRLFGYDADEAAGRPITDLVVPQERREESLALSRRAARGERVGLETVRRRRDGGLVEVSILAVPVEVDGGGVQVYGIYRDISAWRRAEAALHESELHMRSLLEGVRAVVWERDAESLEFRYVSPGVERILGYPLEQWYADAAHWTATLHPDDRARVRACLAGATNSREATIEYRAIDSDGATVWLRDMVHVVREGDGQPGRLRGVTLDITDEKSLEEQLRQAQKMEAIGRLAGGIAHDFNNVLTAIQGHAQLLFEGLEEQSPLREDAEEVRRAATRAASLTRQLLAFSRRQILKPEPLDLNGIVAGVEKMLRRVIGEDIDFEATLAPDLGRVSADPGQIEQVLLNLAVNARDAMPRGGRLWITTSNTVLGEEITSRYVHPGRPGPYVQIQVGDTGSGMPPEVRERVFEPFFTTKEQGKGTGLGLSTVYGIVKQSSGYIFVASEEGQGTTVDIYLPILDDPDAAAQPAEEQGTVAAGSKGSDTVLVVEDEDAVRALVGRVLRKQGYEVIEAPNGRAALRLAELHGERIRLVVTDVVMPEMGGRELAEQLRRARPELRFLFMSGYTDDAAVRRDIADGHTYFLEKPFSPTVLARTIHEALTRDPA
jgi:two-component system, cell cycle sensor histidine kinase and response regulator CckA